MGENEFNFREWRESWAKDEGQGSSPSSAPDGRGHGQHREQPAKESSAKATSKGGRRGKRVEEKVPAIVEAEIVEVKAKTLDVKSPFVVLKYIESLAGEKDYFRKLEQALKENVSVLVPNMMSMEQFTKCLSNLRDSNIEADKNTGSSDDPMAELRRFLSGEAA